MAITLRTASHDSATTKGSPLTYAEMDANFTSLLDSGGSSLLGFIQSGSGAISDSAQEALRNIPVSVMGWIPVAERAAIRAGTSTTTLTTYIQAAIDANYGRVLYFPAGLYNVGNLTVSGPIVILGEAIAERPASGKTRAGTVFKVVSGTTGSVIAIDRGTTYWDYENHTYGVALKNFMMDGAERGVNVHAIEMKRVDRLVLEGLHINDFKYSALRFYSGVRESWFSRVYTRYCGSIADSFPCVDLRMQEDSTVHNNLRFSDCFFVFPLGNAIEIAAFSGAASGPTQINFDNCYVHGITSDVDADPYTFTAAQKTLTLLKIGLAGRVNSIATRWFVGGDAAPSIDLTTDADDAATILSVVGGEVSNHYASTGDYDAFKVVNGTLICDGVTTIGNSKSVNQSGGNVYLSPTCNFNETPTLIANATAQRWRLNSINLSGGTITNLGNIEVGNVKASSTSSALVIMAEQDSSATAATVFQTKNGSGTQLNRVQLGSGATPEMRVNIPIKLVNHTNANRPAATTYSSGAVIWNTDDNMPNFSDGTNWRDAAGNVT
jgi:hypothetical protein